MFKSFLDAPNKKCWESEQFDQWVLGCYPNGHTKNDKGNAMIYLKCVGLPPSIYGVKIRYTLFCPQTNLKWSYIQNYNYANTNYANATFKTSTLNSLKSLSFEITINVLKLYDLNRKEVEYKSMKKHIHLPSPSILDQAQTTNKSNKKNKKNDKKNDKTNDKNDEEKEIQIQGDIQTGPALIVHNDGSWYNSPNIDIAGAIQGIKDKLIGAKNANENDDNGLKDHVQEQITIYSKELQSMNKEIHLIRKGFKELETKVLKSNQAFQTVLKQVKIIKNEVVTIKKDVNKNEETNISGNEEKTTDDEVSENVADDNKVNNGDVDNIENIKSNNDYMMKLIESQNKIIEQFKNEMKVLKDDMEEIKNTENVEDKDNDKIEENKENEKYQQLMTEIADLKQKLNEKEDKKIDNDDDDNDKEIKLNVDGLKENIKTLKIDYNSMNEKVMKLDKTQTMTDNKLVEEITNLKKEVIELKKTNENRIIIDEKLENELKEMKDKNDKLTEKLSKQEEDFKCSIDELRQEINKLTEQQSSFEESSFALINDLNKEKEKKDDDNKEKDEEKEKRIKKVREWVFSKLNEWFNKTDLESVFNKLINDGFDDISLLSELNDDALKSMGIHKRGDRVKILKAIKTDQNNNDQQ